MAESLDVKSLFKPKKKGLKAFNLSGVDETASKVVVESQVSIDMAHEPDFVPVASIKLQEAPEFKATLDEASKKVASANWTTKNADVAPVVEVEVAPLEPTKSNKYVPPSRSSFITKPKVADLPSLAEAARLAKPTPQAASTKPAPAVIISAEEIARKEREAAEKEERKRKLQEEINRSQAPASSVEPNLPEDCKIVAGSIAEISAKYLNRPKIGRSF